MAPVAFGSQDHGDIRYFLEVCSKLLHENVGLLESAANRVSELVLGGTRPDPDLVVALQGFDRLKQEFEALSQTLAGYSGFVEANKDASDRKRYLRETVETIGVAELQERLLLHLGGHLYEHRTPPSPETAQIDVDVEF